MSIFSNAKCIWSDDIDTVNQYVAFKDSFLTGKADRVLLGICVDSQYAVYMNGNYIKAQQYSDYPDDKTYDLITIPEAYLKKNEQNQLYILAYCQNDSSSVYRKGVPFLIYTVFDENGNTLAASSSSTLCNKNSGFVNGEIEKVSVQYGFSFRYEEALSDDATWQNAVEYGALKKYKERPIAQLEVDAPVKAKTVAQGVFIQREAADTAAERVASAYLKPREVHALNPKETFLPSTDGIYYQKEEGTDGIYVVVDMQAEQAGYLFFECESETDFRMDIGYGEHLGELRVRTAMGGRHFGCSFQFRAGRKKFFYPFRRIGARYLQLHVYVEKFRLYYAGICPVYYPLTLKEPPKGLNFIQKKIYDTALHTLRLCMHEHFEDTPWREQALYAMDARNEMFCSFCISEDRNYGRENLRLLGQGLRKDGFLELCAPAEVDVNIPCFSLIWVIALGEYVRDTKDTFFAMEMWDILLRILENFMQYYREDILYNPTDMWGFYEWAPGLDGTNEDCSKWITRNGEADSPLNAFFVMALREAAYIAELLGRSSDRDRWLALIETTKTGYRKYFWDKQKEAYCLSTEPGCRDIFPVLTQVLTICAQLYDTPEEKEALLLKLTQKAFYPDITLSHRLFYYQAFLTEPGYRDFILEDINKNWGEMLFQGATTFWETDLGDIAFDNAGSLCHGWSSIPIYIYHKLFEDKL